MSISAKQSYPKIIRFYSKAQKNDAKKLAKKSNQSLNGYILSLIDRERELYQQQTKQ